jgi:hypothetical protein
MNLVAGRALVSFVTISNASPPGMAASKSTTAGLCFLASVTVPAASVASPMIFTGAPASIARRPARMSSFG